jgi:type I restriction enzyme S subunit
MLVPVPTEREIGHIVQAFDSLERSTEANESQLNKLRQLKLGLMHDLLTGRVRVKASESEGVPA